MQEPDPVLTLDYGFKTRLFWIASRANNCQYCLGHQESKLLAVGMAEDRIAALDSDWSNFPPEEQVAFAFARRLTLEPHLLTDADVDACRKYYTDLQILEMALSVGGNNAINRWKEGIGVPQSSGGGNFGSEPREEHSYLTKTSESYTNVPSKVIGEIRKKGGDSPFTSILPTHMDRSASLEKRSSREGLLACAARQSRLPLVSDARAREVLGDLAPSGTVPGWMRLLANFPVAGKRQVAGFIAAEKELALGNLLRAQMAWVIARQNAAWYALSEAQRRLELSGQSPEQIAALEGISDHVDPASSGSSSFGAGERALLIMAKNLAASPVILTDAQVAEAVKLVGPRDVVQAVHYTAMRSLFDRFTEAAALSADQ